MSRTTHFVLQLCLLVIWVLLLLPNSSVTVSSQTCTQPDYMWKNPLRKFWRPTIGNVVVKIDSLFATQYPGVPGAATRISAGNQMWNDATCWGGRFTDFGQRSFTEAEYDMQPPSGQVWWLVDDPGNGFNGGVGAHYGPDDRVISADIKVVPGLVVGDPVYFNYLGTHEIGHTFNLLNCTTACTPSSIMGGHTNGVADAAGPGVCDIQKVNAQYCPTPTPSPTPTAEPLPTPCEGHCPGIVAICQSCFGPEDICAFPDNNGCQSGLYNISGCCCAAETPILIDVLGDGFNLTDPQNGVNFDVDINGTPERVSWPAANSDDAWLVLDRNGDQLIDTGGELFGNHTAQPEPVNGNARNGFLALAEFDKYANGGNEDGFITEADEAFDSLRLWQDINHNGISESLELKTLKSLGLSSIELDYRKSRRVDVHGNIFLFRAKIRDDKNAQMNRWAWDVVLARGQ